MVVPDSVSAPSSDIRAIGLSGDNERVERVPDDEAAEIAAQSKAPLPEYLGTTVDTEA